MEQLGVHIGFGPIWLVIDKGGPVVVVIGLISIVALAVALAKFVQFAAIGVGRGRAIAPAIGAWGQGETDRALARLARHRSPAARSVACAIRHIEVGRDEAIAREDAARVAEDGLAGLRSHLRVLEAASQVAPLLGLFGTVLGMMSAFQALQAAGGEADPAALAGGIWVALITTAVGLAVAIPAGLALYWFEGRIERDTVLAETALAQVFTTRDDISRAAGRARPDAEPAMTSAEGRHAAE